MLHFDKWAIVRTVLLAATLGAGASNAQQAIGQADRSANDAVETGDRALEEIARLFRDGQHGEVVAEVDRFTAAQATTLENVAVLFFKAESQYQLGRHDAAVRTYHSALARVEALAHNVTRRRFATAYFRLAEILREQRQLDAAIGQVEAGLRLAPQYVEGQIFLGHLLTESGRRERALVHYRKQLASSVPIAEERAVLGIKVDRLAGGEPGTSITPPDLGSVQIYSGLSIGIVAVNQVPADVALSDVCLILESSWHLRCEVLPPLTIPDAAILDAKRGQYAGDLMLAEIERRMPRPARAPSHVLAITGRDIFGPQTNFVFSWQRRNETQGVGVLSTSRFTTGIPEYYEPDIVATRRIALQALSTTGSMLGFTRPTDPECPLAYPESFREFQHKRLRLCPSDEQQRDQLLSRRGGASAPLERSRAEMIVRIHRRYFIE